METNANRSEDFLLELYNQTEGNPDNQVSMHNIGEAIGMEKGEASSLAEDLIMDQFVELKTLSGGIGITTSGLEFLQRKGIVQSGATTTYHLSSEKILTTDDREAITSIVTNIQMSIPHVGLTYNDLEEFIIDVKTLETQLLSSTPKTAVVRELLRALCDSLEKFQHTQLTEEISNLLGE